MKFALKDRSYSEIINGSFSLCEIRFRIDMLVTFSCVIRSSYDSLEINSISKIAMLLSNTTSYISNRCYLLRVASTVILVINKFIRATQKPLATMKHDWDRPLIGVKHPVGILVVIDHLS